MTSSEIILHKAPLVFLKRVAWITLFFALLPLAVVLALDLRQEYAASDLAGTVPSFTLFVLLVLALLQFLIVIVSFVTWYVPVYVINRRQIVYRPGLLSAERQLVETPRVESVDLRQGPLGRRFNYGDLVIGDGNKTETLKAVPDPGRQAELILQLVEPRRAADAPARPIAELIAQGENSQVEYKASLLWDYRRGSINKDLVEPVMKTLAAFMNTDGGTLVIGVDDEGQVLGIERDFTGLPKKNVDGWENAFNLAFNQLLGADLHRYIRLDFQPIDEAVICVARVQPSQTPCYLIFKGQEEFYIRTGNSSRSLPVSKATRYIQTRFAA